MEKLTNLLSQTWFWWAAGFVGLIFILVGIALWLLFTGAGMAEEADEETNELLHNQPPGQ